MLKIGITGGIGCGKSEVCKLLKKAGVPIIHADEVAKLMINNKASIKRQIKHTFGEKVYRANGKLDSEKVAEIVFNDEAAKNRINEIVHPQVIKYHQQVLLRLEKSGKYKVAGVEAALIFESASSKLYDYIIVVSTSMENIVARLMKRNGMGKEEIQKRIAAQMPLAEKVNRADYVIINDGSLDDLEIQVNKLLAWLSEKMTNKER
jgi:dephospho-CoA kinase